MRKSKSGSDPSPNPEKKPSTELGHGSSTQCQVDDVVQLESTGTNDTDNKAKEVADETNFAKPKDHSRSPSLASMKRGSYKTAGSTPQLSRRSRSRSRTPPEGTGTKNADGDGNGTGSKQVQDIAPSADISRSQILDEIRQFKQIERYLDEHKFPPHKAEKLFKSPIKKNKGSTAGHTPPPTRSSKSSRTSTPAKLPFEKSPALAPDPQLITHIVISIPALAAGNEAVPESSGLQPVSHIYIRIDPPRSNTTDHEATGNTGEIIRAQDTAQETATPSQSPSPPPSINLCAICDVLPRREQTDVLLDQHIIPADTLRNIWNMIKNVTPGRSSRNSNADGTLSPRTQKSPKEEIPRRKNVKTVSALEYVLKHKTKSNFEQFIAKSNKLPVLKTKPQASKTVRSTLQHVFGTNQWWFLLILFCATHAFSFYQPIWDKSNAEFVRRHYDLTGAGCEFGCDSFQEKCQCVKSNSTVSLTQQNVNDFVEVLHMIIVKEGCQKLDRNCMATNFEDDGPIIPNNIIYDDLRRNFSYSAEQAKEVIGFCKTLFYSSTFDVVKPRENGFIYLNDSLMKYCGYKFDYYADALLFVVLVLLFYILHILLRLIFDNYIRPKLIEIAKRCCKKD